MISTESLYQHFKENPSISTDSRNIIPGSIFFALKGPAFNGNTFAEAAIKKGAAHAVVDEEEYVKNDKCLLVKNGLNALQDLATFHRKQLSIPFLAITGSNGKTTTKELIRNILSKKYKTVATKGNLNNHIGVPLTILSIPSDAGFAVIEMGANHLHEIESYCRIAEPDYGLITNVGKAHLEGFGGFEGVKKGKGELYAWIAKGGKAIFMNGDNNHLQEMSAGLSIPDTIRYGSSKENYCNGVLLADVPQLRIGWSCGEKSGEATSKLVGSYNFENILSAICIGNYFGVDAIQIDKAIEEYVPDNSRSQVINKGTNTIILDAYNANPTSMEAALNNFKKISKGNKIVFIGEMAELGSETEKEHLRLVTTLKTGDFGKIILVGKNFSVISEQVTDLFFEDSEKAADWLKENPASDAVILIKGSRSTKMERILDAF